MPSKTTLNVANLQNLGEKTLAETLSDISKGNPQISQRLKLQLAAKHDPSKLLTEMKRALEGIGKATKILKRTEQKRLALQLEAYRKMIVDSIKDSDAMGSLELLFLFLSLYDSISDRCYGRLDYFESTYMELLQNIGDFAKLSKQKPVSIAEIFFSWYQKYLGVDSGPYIRSLAPSLGETGLEHLNNLVRELDKKELAETKKRNSDPKALEAFKNYSPTSRALWTIAALRNDVDTYVEYYFDYNNDPVNRALSIGMVMIRAGQEKNAVKLIRKELDENSKLMRHQEIALMDLLIFAYDSSKMREKAQESRLEVFHRFLSYQHLQNYLQKLPDFEDIEAEEKALDYVESFSNLDLVAKFWYDKGDFQRLNDFVLAEFERLEGCDELTLNKISIEIEDQYPLAAILVLRAIINNRVKYDCSWEREINMKKLIKICENIAEKVPDFGSYKSNRKYLQSIKYHSSWSYFFKYEVR